MSGSRSAFLRVTAALAVVFIFTGGVHQLRSGVNAAPDFPCSVDSAVDVSIEISKGATGSAIALQLYEAGVIKSSPAFFRLAVADKRSTMIAPGAHILGKEICAADALDQLLDSKRIAGLINIIEGAWSSEIIKSMVAAGFKETDIKSAISQIRLPTGLKVLEGLLFPAQYSFAKGTSAQDALQAMMDRAMTELSKSGITTSAGKYNAQQLVTMASIIQAEGSTQDFAKISRVIHNRLEKGMPLQMDSTVHYVQKVRGNIFLSTKSTLLKSDYNTYRKYGLPPGPICNPGFDALFASANPAEGDWIYFITVAPGDTRFTESNDQFSTWKIEYKKNLRAGLFGSSK
ncbi:MAG: endolytic transglycosylase MltG [Candidatus Planktophila sp.]|nr:endolytic transglycosylase MltG [Candidatus Planktophila sp.]